MWFKLKLADMCILQAHRIVTKIIFLEYPIPEIPDDSKKKSGTDRVLPKIIGSGRVSGTRQSLALADQIQLYKYKYRLISNASQIYIMN